MTQSELMFWAGQDFNFLLQNFPKLSLTRWLAHRREMLVALHLYGKKHKIDEVQTKIVGMARHIEVCCWNRFRSWWKVQAIKQNPKLALIPDQALKTRCRKAWLKLFKQYDY